MVWHRLLLLSVVGRQWIPARQSSGHLNLLSQHICLVLHSGAACVWMVNQFPELFLFSPLHMPHVGTHWARRWRRCLISLWEIKEYVQLNLITPHWGSIFFTELSAESKSVTFSLWAVSLLYQFSNVFGGAVPRLCILACMGVTNLPVCATLSFGPILL